MALPRVVFPRLLCLPTILVLACDGGTAPPPKDTDVDTSAGHTGRTDTAESGDTDDTDETATDDTGAPPVEPGPHTWSTSFDLADLTILTCGSDDQGVHVFAPGPDLDGDGAAELIIGAPGNDEVAANGGVLYLLGGADVTDGVRTWDATTRVLAPDDVQGFGTRVTWVGDRDGDGVDDLVAEDENYGLWTVSGDDLRGGGDVMARARVVGTDTTFTRWADVDGDGRDDWLFATLGEGPRGSYTGEGAVGLVYDTDFTLDAVTRSVVSYGTEIRSAAGTAMAAMEEDRDGDGLPEFAISMYDDVHIISSAAFLAGPAQLIDAALTSAPYLSNHQVFAPGDITGDGRDELIVFDPGNKVCVLDGADEDGSEKSCIRDTLLGPDNGGVLGDDLDGDTVADLWVARDGYVVALDVGALARGIELELVRVAPPTPLYTLSAGDGYVWASPSVTVNGGEADVGYAFTSALSATRERTIRGGKWGGRPGAPVWRDVSGDGVVDLVVPEASADHVAAFDGTTLAAGGTLSWCDATWSREWTDLTPLWVDDVDGDGTADRLHIGRLEDGIREYTLWSGQVAVGLADGDPLRTWTSDVNVSALLDCDIDGDGRQDLGDVHGTEWTVYGGALAESGGFEPLGTLVSTSLPGCLPDLDDDGGDEVYTTRSGATSIYRSSQLTPGTPPSTPWVELSGGDWSGPEPIRNADGAGLAGWWTSPASNDQLCLLDLTEASGAYTVSEAPMTCLPDVYGSTFYAVAWLDAVNDDATDDIVLYGSMVSEFYGVRLVDGATLGAATDLVVPTDMAWVGPAPDPRGTAGRAIWALWTEDPNRPRIDVLYPRAIEETP